MRSMPAPGTPHRAETLAVAGGRPQREHYLPYGRQDITDADLEAVRRVLVSDFLTTGPAVGAFESDFSARIGVKHAVAVSNGTAALDVMLKAARLPHGSEVITTPLTFVATANAILYNGARPIFADIEADTLNVDPAKVAACIGPKTKAIIAVHFGGLPASMRALRDLAEDHGLMLFEDAAHALGGREDGREVGSLGAAATFSFHPVKHITTGEGGMVTTDDGRMAERMRVLRSHGIAVTADRRHGPSANHYYEMAELGHNFRLTDMQAALGRSQLSRLGSNLARRRLLAARYAARLPRDLWLPQASRPGMENAFHLYAVRLGEGWKASRDEIFRAMRAENIGVNVHYPPVHLHPYYRQHLGTAPGLCPIAEAVYPTLLSLPMFHGMADADADDVVAAASKVAHAYA